MIKVSKIECLGGYRLRFKFSDDSVGDYDFSKIVSENGPMVQALRDADYFRRVFLEFGAPTWPNGFDVAPAWLHREIADAGNLSRPAHA
jgi:Protein of unknown function (DUF2442)